MSAVLSIFHCAVMWQSWLVDCLAVSEIVKLKVTGQELNSSYF